MRKSVAVTQHSKSSIVSSIITTSTSLGGGLLGGIGAYYLAAWLLPNDSSKHISVPVTTATTGLGTGLGWMGGRSAGKTVVKQLGLASHQD